LRGVRAAITVTSGTFVEAIEAVQRDALDSMGSLFGVVSALCRRTPLHSGGPHAHREEQRGSLAMEQGFPSNHAARVGRRGADVQCSLIAG
jgi:hypothetical protein